MDLSLIPITQRFLHPCSHPHILYSHPRVSVHSQLNIAISISLNVNSRC